VAATSVRRIWRISRPAEMPPSTTEPPAIRMVAMEPELTEALSQDGVGHRAPKSSDRDCAGERAGGDGDTPAA